MKTAADPVDGMWAETSEISKYAQYRCTPPIQMRETWQQIGSARISFSLASHVGNTRDKAAMKVETLSGTKILTRMNCYQGTVAGWPIADRYIHPSLQIHSCPKFVYSELVRLAFLLISYKHRDKWRLAESIEKAWDHSCLYISLPLIASNSVALSIWSVSTKSPIVRRKI